MLATRVRYADGQLDDIAAVLCNSQPRAVDYLDQAPALAAVVPEMLGSHVTYGEVDRFGARVASGIRLKDLLAHYGVSQPLRRLMPTALRVKDRAVLRELARLDNSTLAQCIPGDSQRVWLDGLTKWLRLAPAVKRPSAHFNIAWIARRLGEDLSRFEQIEPLIDFLGRGRMELNERWSWERALAEVAGWHVRLRDEAALRRLAAYEREALSFDTVICRSALPDAVAHEGYRFRVLRTLRQLREEGEAMHHCVAAYAPDVRKGRCAIVSVSRDNVSVGTLQIDSAGTIVQLKAHCNAPVAPAVKLACEGYALLQWRAPENGNGRDHGERN